MASKPYIKAINLQTDRTPAVIAINLQTDICDLRAFYLQIVAAPSLQSILIQYRDANSTVITDSIWKSTVVLQ